jgi:hypothetical protein
MTASWRIPRRAFLRGMGAAVALPMLDAMAPAAQAAPKPPCRMVAILTPIGMNMDTWTPKTVGTDFEIPETLTPLVDLRSHFSILSGLCHPRVWGGHETEGASFLTGTDILSGTPGCTWKNTISVDQLAAERVGHETRFSSLELMKGRGGRSFQLSWSREGVAQSAETDPAAVFDRLFLDEKAGEKDRRDALLRKRQSILDLVRSDLQRLEGRVGRADREKLDQYATAVREVEIRVRRAEDWAKKPRPKVEAERPAPLRDGGDKDRLSHFRTMLDLTALAFQTDSTRIVTYAMSDSNSEIVGSGVKDSHHGLSHHGGNMEAKKKLTQLDRAHIAQLAGFLGRLKATSEGDGTTLLDNSMILYGSGLGDASRHTHKDLPILIAGHARGAFKQGAHRRYPSTVTPLSNLFVAMLRQMGVGLDSFADSTGAFTEL